MVVMVWIIMLVLMLVLIMLIRLMRGGMLVGIMLRLVLLLLLLVVMMVVVVMVLVLRTRRRGELRRRRGQWRMLIMLTVWIAGLSKRRCTGRDYVGDRGVVFSFYKILNQVRGGGLLDGSSGCRSGHCDRWDRTLTITMQG